MITLRCTRKLLNRLSQPEVQSLPTTVLGDWSLKEVQVLQPKHLLCVSERSLLPVIIPMKDIESLGSRLATAVGETLLMLGVPALQVEKELAEMRTVVYGPTQIQQVRSSLNQFTALFLWHVKDHPGATLADR